MQPATESPLDNSAAASAPNAGSAPAYAPSADAVDVPAIRVGPGRSVLRLGRLEWLSVCLIVGSVLVGVPAWRARSEAIPLTGDFRIPFTMNEDYWTFRQLIERCVAQRKIPVLGDSFVWGQYVPPSDALSSRLNAAAGSALFVNAGLNGAHPLALCGLIEHYASRLQGGRVVLHCNLLWMSSPERDLQSSKDVAFNHPRLIPQFVPSVPAYHANIERRMGIIVDRNVPFFEMVDHVRRMCFDERDLHNWTIAHPYDNPLARLGSRTSPGATTEPAPEAVSWTKAGIDRQDFPWLDLDASQQWRAWREAAEFLRSNGNDVLVVVGPFNEHLLLESSRGRYSDIKRQAEDWLRAHGFRYFAPTALPSEEYGDASHPLAIGYQRLARDLAASAAFREWLRGP